MVPRSAQLSPPASAFWIEISVASLRAVVEDLLRARAGLLTAEERAIPEAMIAVWYARPGAELSSATPIDPETELLGNPFTAGTYYARTLGSPPRPGEPLDAPRLLEGARFYKAEASPPPAPRAIESQMVHARALETELAYSATLSRRLNDSLGETDRKHRALQDAEDEVRRQKREIEQLSAELAAMREDANPLFSDEIMVKLIEQLTTYLNLPSGGTSQKYLEELFDAFLTFVQIIAQDATILATIVHRQPKAWDKITGVFNRIAANKLNDSRIPPARHFAQALAQAAANRQAELARREAGAQPPARSKGASSKRQPTAAARRPTAAASRAAKPSGRRAKPRR